MDSGELVIVAIAALAGSTLTAIAGLGGGILLLAVLLQFLDAPTAIPVHAAIQLVSNGSRAVILRADVERSIVLAFATLLVPAGLLGLWATDAIPPAAGRIAIAVFALLATWQPRALGALSAALGTGRRGFVALGGIAGFLNIPLGVTGPAVAPFFRRALDDRRQVVATFAATQVLGHLVKIVLFGGDGFAYGDHLALMTIGSLAVIAGSWIGTRLLGRVSEDTFRRLFRFAITAIALRIIATAIL